MINRQKVIMAAIDGSEGAAAALRRAATVASTDGAELVVLTVTPREHSFGRETRDLEEFARVERLQGGETEAATLAAEDILEEAKEVLQDCGCDADPVYLARAGNPVEEILACADEEAADALYLGSRSLGPVGKLLLGRVSNRVARAARCRVVIVPRSK